MNGTKEKTQTDVWTVSCSLFLTEPDGLALRIIYFNYILGLAYHSQYLQDIVVLTLNFQRTQSRPPFSGLLGRG
jgi:hypothetical protein